MTKLTVTSFGFIHGEPPEADVVLDARVLRNPHRDRRLRVLTGLDKAVQEDVKSGPGYSKFIAAATTQIGNVAALDVTVAVGCMGGKHRAITIAEELAVLLQDEFDSIEVVHRELPRYRK